jgi:hypothetical protein
MVARRLVEEAREGGGARLERRRSVRVGQRSGGTRKKRERPPQISQRKGQDSLFKPLTERAP